MSAFLLVDALPWEVGRAGSYPIFCPAAFSINPADVFGISFQDRCIPKGKTVILLGTLFAFSSARAMHSS